MAIDKQESGEKPKASPIATTPPLTQDSLLKNHNPDSPNLALGFCLTYTLGSGNEKFSSMCPERKPRGQKLPSRKPSTTRVTPALSPASQVRVSDMFSGSICFTLSHTLKQRMKWEGETKQWEVVSVLKEPGVLLQGQIDRSNACCERAVARTLTEQYAAKGSAGEA